MRLFGKNPVIERLRNNPQSIRKIYIQQGFDKEDYVKQKARKWGIPVLVVDRDRMGNWGRNINTQGIMVDVGDFQYADFNDLLDEAKEKKRILVFLDRINDPQNLGAIIRSLACLGKFAVVLPKKDSAHVTEAVLRVASGGDNFVPVALVANLTNMLKKAKTEGIELVGAAVKDGQDLTQTKFTFPLGLVLGSEQKGIRDVTGQQIDTMVTIPTGVGQVSFNVAHAAAIIAYEITKQRIAKS